MLWKRRDSSGIWEGEYAIPETPEYPRGRFRWTLRDSWWSGLTGESVDEPSGEEADLRGTCSGGRVFLQKRYRNPNRLSWTKGGLRPLFEAIDTPELREHLRKLAEEQVGLRGGRARARTFEEFCEEFAEGGRTVLYTGTRGADGTASGEWTIPAHGVRWAGLGQRAVHGTWSARRTQGIG